MTLRKISHLLLIALLTNSIALATFKTDELRGFFTSVVDFAITILPSNQTPLTPPHNTRPRNNMTITLPSLFSVTTPEDETQKTRWLFRGTEGTYDTALLVIESDGGVRNIKLQKGQLKSPGKYFWETQRISVDGLESAFSEETSFTIGGKPTFVPFKKAVGKNLTPSLSLNLKSNQIKKGDPLEVNIEGNKRANVTIEIASADGETKATKKAAIDATGQMVTKTFNETRTLPGGDYVVVMSFDDGETTFARAASFSVAAQSTSAAASGPAQNPPSPQRQSAPDTTTKILLWLEVLLAAALGACSGYAFYLGRKLQR